MIILVLVLASVAVALMRGGRLANLGRLEFRFIYLLYLPLLLQLVIYSPLPHLWNINILGTPYVYVFSMLIGVGVLLMNLHIPGFVLVLLGLLSNLLVIEANGGYMPVSMEAREFAVKGNFPTRGMPSCTRVFFVYMPEADKGGSAKATGVRRQRHRKWLTWFCKPKRKTIQIMD